MRQPAFRLLLAAIAGIAASSAAFATEESFAAWQAARRVQAAQAELSDRYSAIWATLDAGQKSRFSAQERAWLNEGRQLEQQACVRQAGRRSAALASTCEADVIERHLAALAVPQQAAVSR